MKWDQGNLFAYHSRPAVSQIENDDVRKYVKKYLDVGEWMFDNSVMFMNNSPYFERKSDN